MDSEYPPDLGSCADPTLSIPECFYTSLKGSEADPYDEDQVSTPYSILNLEKTDITGYNWKFHPI